MCSQCVRGGAPGGEDLIGWHVNRGKDKEADFFPSARFRGVCHRPDVIDRVLETLDKAEALTGGRQTPTTAKPATVPDFPIATARQR